MSPHLKTQLPACRFAAAEIVPTQDPARDQVLFTCSAPANLSAACGYPVGRCPHHGPYRSTEERAEDTSDCLIRQALGL